MPHPIDTWHEFDLIRWDDAGRIVDFKVMVRPLEAVDILHQKMGELLARLKQVR